MGGCFGVDGKNPSQAKVLASLWQAQKQNLISRCKPKYTKYQYTLSHKKLTKTSNAS